MSGPNCTVCVHPQREEINQGLAEGRSQRSISDQFGPSKTAVQRHARLHLPAGAIVRARAPGLTRAEDILLQLAELQASSLAILRKAEEVGDLRAGTAAITSARGNLELIAKLIGELREGPVVNIIAAPEWTGMRDAILVALQPFPQARIAVAEALRQRDAIALPAASVRTLPAAQAERVP